MQLAGEGVGGIDDEADAMPADEGSHCLCIHRPVNARAVMKRQQLLTRLRTVIIGVASLFEHLSRLAPFRRSTKYEYHASPCRKRWVKCLS